MTRLSLTALFLLASISALAPIAGCTSVTEDVDRSRDADPDSPGETVDPSPGASSPDAAARDAASNKLDAGRDADVRAPTDAAQDAAPGVVDAALACAPGASCATTGQTCGTFDGLLARACECRDGGAYVCGDAAPPQQACAAGQPAPILDVCKGNTPFEVVCASSTSAGCLMAACYGAPGLGGGWAAPCEIACPPTQPACGAACAPGSPDCGGCTKNGAIVACTCFAVTQTASLWLCP